MSFNRNDVRAELMHASLALLRDMMCVKDGESVLITADSNSDWRVVQAMQNAAYLLGAKPAALVLDPPLPLQGLLADKFIPAPVAAAVDSADVWIDCCNPYMAGSLVFDKVMRNGRTRYLLAADLHAEAVIRMFGKVDVMSLFAVTEQFQALIDAAAGKEFHITSPKGTDVRFNTLALPKDSHIGIARATRAGGYFAPGTAAMIPIMESVRGRIVCESVYHEYYTALPDPIVIEVEGRIRSVTGGSSEQKVMERALRRAGNGEYGSIVHFSCGHHPAARFTGTCFVEDQRAIGCNAIGFGFPPGMPGGGENHPDGVVKDQSIWIDGEQIVDCGVISGPASLAAAVNGLPVLYR